MPKFAFFPPRLGMHALFHRLAMCAVLLHTLGGCCWHHVHAGHSLGQVFAACDHAEDDDRDQPHHRPHHDPAGCHEPGCAFVVPEYRTFVALLARLQPLPSVSTDMSAAVSTALCRPELDAPPLAGRPSLRLHLLNQVLLI